MTHKLSAIAQWQLGLVLSGVALVIISWASPVITPRTPTWRNTIVLQLA